MIAAETNGRVKDVFCSNLFGLGTVSAFVSNL